MRRYVAIAGAAALPVAFAALLGGADVDARYYVLVSAQLLGVIVGVVLVSTLFTVLYLLLFGGAARRWIASSFSLFVGWTLLRSHRVTPTLGTRVRRLVRALRVQPRSRAVVSLGVGLALLGLARLLAGAAWWNRLAEAFDPTFATTLCLALAAAGGLLALFGLPGLPAPPSGTPRPPRMRSRTAVTLPSFISIVGVSIGIWALIVVLSVMHGFEADLRRKILRTNAHVVVQPERAAGAIRSPFRLEDAVRELPEVRSAHVHARGEVMVASSSNVSVNIVVKGMAPEALEGSAQLGGRMQQGAVSWLDRPELLLRDRGLYAPRDDEASGDPEAEDEVEPLPPDGTPAPTPGSPPAADGADGAPPSPSPPPGAEGGTAAPEESPSDAPKAPEPTPLPSGSAPEGSASAPPSAADQPIRPGVLLGVELARSLHVEVGDEVQVISPEGEVGPTGLRPKLRDFRVAGTFQTGMYEYDRKLAYMTIGDAQRFLNLGPRANRLEVRLDSVERTGAALASIRQLLSERFSSLQARDWKDRNRSLFSALQLERIVMFVVLGFIILVASLLIVSSLVMLVVEKASEIATLKALGASSRAIVRSFLLIGALIGAIGSASGLTLGVGTCLAIQHLGVPLPQEYYIASLPVRLDPVEATLVAAAAMALCLLATLYPCREASRLEPVEGLRHG